jgi:hypothetical protein
MQVTLQIQTEIKQSQALSTKQNSSNILPKRSLSDLHQLGLKGIFIIHPFKAILRKPPFLISLAVAILCLILLLFWNVDNYKILGQICSLGISVFPNLLGFSLGGFALIVGFGNQSAIKSMASEATPGQPSLYQKTTAIFAYSLLIQSITLVLAVLTSLILGTEIIINAAPAAVINIFAICLLIFTYCWCLTSTMYVVVNIFTFAQCYHLYLLVEDKPNT